ncbi:MAG: hypothetical protein WBG93_00370 [Thermoanaerobaculia bacterium]
MLNRPFANFGSVGTLTVLGLGLVLGLVGTALQAEDDDLPLNFDAIAVNLANVGPRGSARLQIRVTRWSTEDERAKLMEALKQPEERSLPDALFQQDRVGTIRESQGIGENLRYARRIIGEEGQQIILATDRPLAMVETWRSSRTRRYNVTVIILTLDAEGRGEGQIMTGAELSWDEAKDQLIVEHFASEPIRLTSVRQR